MTWHPDMRIKPRRWDGRSLPGASIEEKLDGYRCTVEIHELGIRAYGRKAHIHLALPGRMLSKMFTIAPGTVLDGELYVPGVPASQVITYIKAESEELVYRPFAVPFYNHEALFNQTLEQRDNLVRRLRFEPPTRMTLTADDLTPEMLKRLAKSRGQEGWILKQAHYRGWWKVKPTRTVDVVVTGTKPGKGKHKDRIGSMECSLYWFRSEELGHHKMKVIANVGKGEDAAWRDLDPDSVIGRVCEIEYEEMQKSKLKFTSFLRWRDDEKTPAECTWDQLEID